MITWAAAEVLQVTSMRHGIQELQVRLDDGEIANAILYTDDLEEADRGSRVLLNTTAVELGLGTGGVHFVHAVLSSPKPVHAKPAASSGHMMKLRYTSAQRAVLAVEEEQSPYHSLFHEELSLEGMPVLIGELHSMLPIAACWLHYRAAQKGSKLPQIAYVMSDGAALPLPFSKHVDALKRSKRIATTITYGHAFGGELEAMNKFTALLAAKHVARADAAIVTMGPGIAGTGTPLGHTGMEAGEIAQAVRYLGGLPIIMPRLSFAEQRQRHYGLSHHTRVVFSLFDIAGLSLCLPTALSPSQQDLIRTQLQSLEKLSPEQIVWRNEPTLAQIESALSTYPLRVTTMGRGLSADPAFFLASCAAAEWAGQLLE